MITPQQAFDRIWKYFVIDNNPPYAEKKEPNIFLLKFQWPNGKKDVVGLFIKEGCYKEELEKQDIRATVPLLDFVTTADLNDPDSGINETMQLIMHCQQYHDISAPHEENAAKVFQQHLTNIANMNGLTIPAIPQPTQDQTQSMTTPVAADSVPTNEPDTKQSSEHA